MYMSSSDTLIGSGRLWSHCLCCECRSVWHSVFVTFVQEVPNEDCTHADGVTAACASTVPKDIRCGVEICTLPTVCAFCCKCYCLFCTLPTVCAFDCRCYCLFLYTATAFMPHHSQKEASLCQHCRCYACLQHCHNMYGMICGWNSPWQHCHNVFGMICGWDSPWQLQAFQWWRQTWAWWVSDSGWASDSCADSELTELETLLNHRWPHHPACHPVLT